MACLRDIGTLFGPDLNPFYAGFGNRITDALSYRSVNVPSQRIFTINPNAEVSIDILALTKYKSSYVSMRELVDHFFPPVGLLVGNGGEAFTDFSYWREPTLGIEDFSDSESEDEEGQPQFRPSARNLRRAESEDEGSDEEEEEEEEYVDDEQGDAQTGSYFSRDSIDEVVDALGDSIIESVEGDGGGEGDERGLLPRDGEATPLAEEGEQQKEHRRRLQGRAATVA